MRYVMASAMALLMLAVVACGNTPPPPGGGGGGSGATTLVITFNRIDVVHDCDFGSGQGEFFYSLSINGTTVAGVPENSAVGANDGDSILLGVSRTVTVYPSDTLEISGVVYESDYPSTATLVGSFAKTFTSADNWGITGSDYQWVHTLYNSSTCEVKVGYSIR